MQYGLYWPDKEKAAQEAQSPMTHKLELDLQRSQNLDHSAQNLFIEGENLEALKILQKDFQERVKCIYIDPPYNTGKQFLYNDDYTQTPKDRPLVVYCYHGHSSQMAARFLVDQGFTEVYNLEGGYEAWTHTKHT